MNRPFPNPSQTKQQEFIIHSCKLDGIPMNEEIIQEAMSKGIEEGNPYATGHFVACNLVVTNAHKSDLLPSKKLQLDKKSIRVKRSIFTKIHASLMEPVASQGVRLNQEYAIQHYEVGSLRRGEARIGKRVLPEASAVPQLLDELLLDIAEFHDIWKPFFDNPGTLAWKDLDSVVQKLWDFHLRLIYIHPFDEGSGRVARLFLNLARLNCGLPWFVPKSDETDKKEYINQVFELAESFYPKYS